MSSRNLELKRYLSLSYEARLTFSSLTWEFWSLSCRSVKLKKYGSLTSEMFRDYNLERGLTREVYYLHDWLEIVFDLTVQAIFMLVLRHLLRSLARPVSESGTSSTIYVQCLKTRNRELYITKTIRKPRKSHDKRVLKDSRHGKTPHLR